MAARRTTRLNFAGIGFAGKTEKLTLASITALFDGARSAQCVLSPTQPGITLKSK